MALIFNPNNISLIEYEIYSILGFYQDKGPKVFLRPLKYYNKNYFFSHFHLHLKYHTNRQAYQLKLCLCKTFSSLIKTYLSLICFFFVFSSYKYPNFFEIRIHYGKIKFFFYRGLNFLLKSFFIFREYCISYKNFSYFYIKRHIYKNFLFKKNPLFFRIEVFTLLKILNNFGYFFKIPFLPLSLAGIRSQR